ncbi:hypothetical protein ASZ90_006788 [hydrocarbon metagenome]|uniref:Uncharacterized protein n=1 Tax=hydrocarbon metagenome TaxID=938273 RepID=A0A0W8FRK6_9ZZZZ
MPEGSADSSFQSTRPRGARHRLHQKQLPDNWGFNPRALAGRDGRTGILINAS